MASLGGTGMGPNFIRPTQQNLEWRRELEGRAVTISLNRAPANKNEVNIACFKGSTRDNIPYARTINVI